jgi:hypothetical protein
MPLNRIPTQISQSHPLAAFPIRQLLHFRYLIYLLLLFHRPFFSLHRSLPVICFGLLLFIRQLSLLLQLLDIDPLALLETLSRSRRLGTLGAGERARRGGIELIERFEFRGGKCVFAFWSEGNRGAGSGGEELEWEKKRGGFD